MDKARSKRKEKRLIKRVASKAKNHSKTRDKLRAILDELSSSSSSSSSDSEKEIQDRTVIERKEQTAPGDAGTSHQPHHDDGANYYAPDDEYDLLLEPNANDLDLDNTETQALVPLTRDIQPETSTIARSSARSFTSSQGCHLVLPSPHRLNPVILNSILSSLDFSVVNFDLSRYSNMPVTPINPCSFFNFGRCRYNTTHATTNDARVIQQHVCALCFRAFALTLDHPITRCPWVQIQIDNTS